MGCALGRVSPEYPVAPEYPLDPIPDDVDDESIEKYLGRDYLRRFAIITAHQTAHTS